MIVGFVVVAAVLYLISGATFAAGFHGASVTCSGGAMVCLTMAVVNAIGQVY